MNVESKYNSFEEDGVKYLQCKHCYDYRPVSEDTVVVTCSSCTTRIQLNEFPDTLPKSYMKKPTGRPAGWHFMNEFVDKDGNVFHKGKEQPDLKGTLKPTEVKPPKKREKKDKTDQLLDLVKKHKRKLKMKRKSK
tara:strand:+ start:1673 stop:2077 length:405 start_codon:yes stop_codon:yes gene_type:complete